MSIIAVDNRPDANANIEINGPKGRKSDLFLGIAKSEGNPAFSGPSITFNRHTTRRYAPVGGVVYYANYLKFLEHARCRHVFFVRRVEADYLMPAQFNDRLSERCGVRCKPAELAGASLNMHQQVLRGEQLLPQVRSISTACNRAVCAPLECRTL